MRGAKSPSADSAPEEELASLGDLEVDSDDDESEVMGLELNANRNVPIDGKHQKEMVIESTIPLHLHFSSSSFVSAL